MRTVRRVHRWLGLALALPVVLQGLTGAILTLEPLIPYRGGAIAADPPAPANAVLAAARTVAPPGMRLSRYTPAAATGSPALVQFVPERSPRDPGLVLRLDPASATPLGPPEPAGGAIAWIRRLHTNWLVPEWSGRQLVGWLGVGLLLLALLGIPLWWPRGDWRAGFTVPRSARGLLLQRRLHGATGIWLWLMLIASSSTGIVEAFPRTTRAVLGLAPGGPPRPGRTAPGAAAPVPDLDRAIELARTAAPGTVLRIAILPSDASEPIRLFLGPPGSEGVTSATIVSVDAASQRVLSAGGPGTASTAETALRQAHDLHFGQAFGPAWRALTVAVGFALPLFAVTGWLMWLRRRGSRRLAALRRTALEAGE